MIAELKGLYNIHIFTILTLFFYSLQICNSNNDYLAFLYKKKANNAEVYMLTQSKINVTLDKKNNMISLST